MIDIRKLSSPGKLSTGFADNLHLSFRICACDNCSATEEVMLSASRLKKTNKQTNQKASGQSLMNRLERL